MTHTLHRRGTVEDLKRDYVLLAMLARGINDRDPKAKQNLYEIGKIFKQHGPENIITENVWKISPVITASFKDIETVKSILKILKEKKFGISIVISGLISEIKRVASELGLSLHTGHFSLGLFGKKDLLPEEKVLEITTMCGHHCISPQSVEYHVNLIKNNKISLEKAVEKLAKPCVCGITNKSRIREILEVIIQEN
ncbi:MAG: hypothetical protein ACTSXH_15700 [Promethearchaeota archaeon]